MYMVYSVACTLSIGFGAYMFIIALTDDIKHNLNAINDNIKGRADRLKIVEQFSDFIEIHWSAKKLNKF